MKKENLTSLSQFINEKVGIKGTKKRDKYDKEFEAFQTSLYLHPAGLIRPAPAELPQDRKIARVGGCSGAM